MNRQDFTSLMTQARQRPNKVMTGGQLESLGKVVREFPYFQTARALYLKGLKDSESVLYNRFLKETAAHTTDRGVLFEYITSEEFLYRQPATGNGQRETGNRQREDPEATEKTVVFSKSDTHSFSEWLKLTAAKPIVREKDTGQGKPEQTKKFRQIDKFLREKPKIDPKAVDSRDGNLAKPFGKTDKSLMTETLAELYVSQKKYKKAIKAYKILSLKNPKKSGYFADRIRAIERAGG